MKMFMQIIQGKANEADKQTHQIKIAVIYYQNIDATSH